MIEDLFAGALAFAACYIAARVVVALIVEALDTVGLCYSATREATRHADEPTTFYGGSGW